MSNMKNYKRKKRSREIPKNTVWRYSIVLNKNLKVGFLWMTLILERRMKNLYLLQPKDKYLKYDEKYFWDVLISNIFFVLIIYWKCFSWSAYILLFMLKISQLWESKAVFSPLFLLYAADATTPQFPHLFPGDNRAFSIFSQSFWLEGPPNMLSMNTFKDSYKVILDLLLMLNNMVLSLIFFFSK